jgi:hypothetical protein
MGNAKNSPNRAAALAVESAFPHSPGSFMRASRFFISTLKEAPSDAEIVSH